MKYSEVSSIAISGVGYDEKTGQMEVIFVSGQSAMHEDVSKEKYDTFMQAESKGRAYHDLFGTKKNKTVEIKQNFKFK